VVRSVKFSGMNDEFMAQQELAATAAKSKVAAAKAVASAKSKAAAAAAVVAKAGEGKEAKVQQPAAAEAKIKEVKFLELKQAQDTRCVLLRLLHAYLVGAFAAGTPIT
jgi:hypothetical protein